MLLLLDLDNTLIDRAGAFAQWARLFAGEVGARAGWEPGSPEVREAADWIVAADRGGYRPKPELAAAVIERFGLDLTVDRLAERIVYEFVEFVHPYPGVPERLARFSAEGTTLVIVTNGPVEQQSRKLRRTGVDAHVSAVVISEGFGAKKPHPSIFGEAMRRGGGTPADTWMAGDDVTADIEGARALDIRTAWIGHGRAWPHAWRPSIAAETPVEALDAIRDR